MDVELRTECRKVPSRHFLIEFHREEVAIVLAGRGFFSQPQHIKLRQHLVRERTSQQEDTMVKGAS